MLYEVITMWIQTTALIRKTTPMTPIDWHSPARACSFGLQGERDHDYLQYTLKEATSCSVS